MDVSAIASLSRGELQGWHGWLCAGGREPMPGEMAALHDRARKLGTTISHDSSRAALFGSPTVTLMQPQNMSESTHV